MSAAFSELPLALFTTLAAIGSGAFISLACAFFTTKLSDDQFARVDKLSIIPAVVVVIGFIAAFFHLANPAAAFGVFGGIGRSPLSNELCVATIFAIVMVIYVAMALAGKLSEGSRKGFAGALAVLAVVFAVFMGLAYGIETIPTWSSPWPVVQMLGYSLLGGTALGVFVLALEGALGDAIKGSFKTSAMALAGIGAVLTLAGLAMMVSTASGAANAVTVGSNLVAGAMTCLIVAIICLVLAAVSVVMALRGSGSVGAAGLATVLVLAGVLAGRFVFYALQISVGIYF